MPRLALSEEDRRIAERLGKKLRKLRQGLNLTQNEVAKMLGISTASVHQWEQGYSFPSAAILLRLMKIFGIRDIWALVEGDWNDALGPLTQVRTGETVRLGGFYACHKCRCVVDLEQGMLAPSCHKCGSTVWLRRIPMFR